MKEYPIIFTNESISLLLADRITQTRRLSKELMDNPPPRSQPPCNVRYEPTLGYWQRYGGGGVWIQLRYPYGVAGDRLWVQETWGSLEADHPRCPDGRKPQIGDRLVYRANPADDYQWGPGRPSQGSFCWRSPATMPRWASRITLKRTTDRPPERVKDISVEDCWAEGIEPPHYKVPGTIGGDRSVRVCFQEYWDSLNAKRGYGWDANPWVWPIGFRRVKDGLSV